MASLVIRFFSSLVPSITQSRPNKAYQGCSEFYLSSTYFSKSEFKFEFSNLIIYEFKFEFDKNKLFRV